MRRGSWRPRSSPGSTCWSPAAPRRGRPRSTPVRCGILRLVTAAATQAVSNGGARAGSAAGADTVRAAVYCRISDDRRGLGLGVARQRQDCTELAGRSGWQVVATFVDNDVSAYSGKPRPQYAQLMQAVAAGEGDVIVAWDPDRLHRSPAELEDFIAAVERGGGGVVTVPAGEGGPVQGEGERGRPVPG